MPVIPGKYLSQKIEEEGGLKGAIDKYRIVEIISGVGSGKNSWCKKLADVKYTGKPAQILFITSRRAVANEMLKELREVHGSDVKAKLDKHSFDSFPCFVVVTNSGAAKFIREEFDPDDPSTHIWQNIDYIIMDEAHSLSTDNFSEDGFYLEKFFRLCYMKNDKLRFIFMTGTPDPIGWLFSDELKKSGNFKCYNWYKECTRVVPDKIKIIDITSAENILMESLKNGERSIYFIKSINRIGNLIEKIEEKTEGLVTRDDIAIGYSKQFEDKKNNIDAYDPRAELEETYGKDYIKEHCDDIAEEIVNNNKLPDWVQIFITTTKNKEGVNILNDDINIMFAESAVKDEIIQMAGRVRHGLKVMYLLIDREIPFPGDEPDYSICRDERLLDDLNSTLKKYEESIKIYEERPPKMHMSDIWANRHIKIFKKEIQDTFRYIMYDSVIDQKFALYQGRIEGDEEAYHSISVMQSLSDMDECTYYQCDRWGSPFGYHVGDEGATIPGEELMSYWFQGSKVELIYDPNARKEMEKLRLSEARDEIAEYLYANGCLNNFIYTSTAPILLAELNKIYEKHGFEPYKNSLKAALGKVGIDCKRVNNKRKPYYNIGDAYVPSVEEHKALDEYWQYVKKVTAPPRRGFGDEL